MSRPHLLAAFITLAVSSAARADDPATVFEQRIVPIFKSPNPSSCARCHLAAVDLKDYILPSATDTFLALRDQGLIDLEKPESSKILKLINRGAGEKAGANLIPAKQRQAEYDAFAAWIKACAADPALKNAPKPDKAPQLAVKPAEVVRHARKDRLLESFLRYDGAGSLGVAKAQAILGSYFVMTERADAAAQVRERLRLLEASRIERLSAELMAVTREKYWEVNERRMNMEYVPDAQRERLREFLGGLR